MVTPLPESIAAATNRLLDTVDSLADERFAEPSRLPDWTVGHVVAHLALNAEGLTGALRGVAAGEPVPMYASDEARDGDIDELVGAGPEELRTRLSISSAFLAEEIAVLDPRNDETEFERVPGGLRFRTGTMPLLRLREVEIHHADMGVGYSHRDWPEDTVERILDHSAATYHGTPFTVHATDLGREWTFDGGGPVVGGTGSALAWWSTGRSADGLTADGELPRIEGR